MPVATITVDDHADPDFWTGEEAEELAVYVHRMVVRRDSSGHELGGAMLDWASQLAAEQGAHWVRLDAWRDNLDLQAFYASRGFEHLRTVPVEGRGSGALFQRRAGEIRGRWPPADHAAG